MSKPIAIFYHCLFELGDPPELKETAVELVRSQMQQLHSSGLLQACANLTVGINGGDLSRFIAEGVIPDKAKLVMHGLESRAENLTLMEIEKWVKTNPGWNILYFHAKGCTHDPNSSYGRMTGNWREGMMEDCVRNWKQCVKDLDSGQLDIVCSHWMWNMADGTQHIPAGNFLWITSDFAARLPSMYLRQRIIDDGISAVTSRYEAEVYWGNGPKPRVKSYRPKGGGGVP